jgi:Ion channel
VLHLVINPPGLLFSFQLRQIGNVIRYSIDYVVAEVAFIRLYTLFPRVLLTWHPEEWSINNERTARVIKMNGSEPGVLFSLKALLSLRPYLVLSYFLCLSFLLFAFAIRTFELGRVDRCNRFFYLSNAFWLVVQTVTLVGYGDVVPSTHFGRLISVFACLTGVLVLALLVSALSTSTDFSPTEDRVYEAITVERAAREELREEAGNLVKGFLVMTRLRKRQVEAKRRT